MTLLNDDPSGGVPPPSGEPPRRRPVARTHRGRAPAGARRRAGLGRAPADALALYRELLAAEPDHLEGRLHLARLLLQLEELEARWPCSTTRSATRPTRPSFWCSAAGSTASLRLYPEADADLRRVLRLYPSHAPAHLELGRLLWRKGLAAEAATHFRRSLEFQPDNARTCYYLGDALSQAGDLAGSRAALERALQLDPHDAKIYHLLGRVFDRLGQPDEAMRCTSAPGSSPTRDPGGRRGPRAAGGGRGAPAGGCGPGARRARRRSAGRARRVGVRVAAAHRDAARSGGGGGDRRRRAAGGVCAARGDRRRTRASGGGAGPPRAGLRLAARRRLGAGPGRGAAPGRGRRATHPPGVRRDFWRRRFPEARTARPWSWIVVDTAGERDVVEAIVRRTT